uniref:protein PHLOEM PROTEIN 2-LIKE A10-like n=1 Tax=Erigeron canadensis TaxID=72917 RepID=UPI001CB9404B|nr:protein PHLOEM PROTEIN 2-LIKE A10-like [Erigeron canadensis]
MLKLQYMDVDIITKTFNYTHKRKKWILLVTALGLSTYSAYKICNLPSVVKNRNRVLRVLTALASVTELLGDSAETIGVVSKDLKDFIKSDSDELPASLKQVFKITKSDEFSESVVRVTKALTVGLLRGFRAGNVEGGGGSGSGFGDRVLEKMFSSSGSGFVSVVVGSFTRNVVMAICDGRGGSGDGSGQNWVDVIADDKCRGLIGDCIQRFVSTMVTVYLDKTMHVNPYDDILSSLTKPEYDAKVRDLLALVCNGAIETFVRTSHQVLMNSRPNGSSDLLRRSSSTISKVLDGQELVLSKLTGRKNHGNEWASRISSTLAVPSNMRLVLDVAGRVTLATMKSFLGFSWNQLSEGMKRTCREVYRYLTARCLIVMTIWVSLYLHLLSDPWSFGANLA